MLKVPSLGSAEVEVEPVADEVVDVPDVVDQGVKDCGAEPHNREGSPLEVVDSGCYASSNR